MISKALMKKTIKDNWKLWAIITVVMILLIVTSLISSGERATSAMRQYYTMFSAMLPIIFIAITANKLISAKVDNGSLGYIMANPIKRNTITITEALFLISSIIIMFTLISVIGLAIIVSSGIKVEIVAFILLNLGVVLFLIAISGICFLVSCIFNRASTSLALGAGIPIAFFLFQVIASLSSSTQFFKYISLNSLFNASDILSYSSNMIWQFVTLFVIASVCYVGGIIVFKEKDLPL